MVEEVSNKTNRKGMFSLAKNVRSQHLTDATPEEFWALVDDKETGRTCAEIADALELLRRGGLQREEFDRKKSELKLHLPVAMFQGHSTTGRRLNSDMEPSGLALLDIDHVNFPEQVYGTCIRDKEKGLGILLVHKTPSGEGLRVVFRQPKGMAIEEAQRWMAGQLKFKEYDECTKDLARCSFLVPRDYILYLDDHLFDEQIEAPERVEVESVKCDVKSCHDSLPCIPNSELKYRGIPYTDIIADYWNCTGGVPVEGERNVRLHQLAVNLRSICDNKKEVLMQIMPRFGLSDAEVQNIVDSACKEPPKGISKQMQEIIRTLSDSPLKGEEDEDLSPALSQGEGESPKGRFSAKKLPIGLKESLVGVPESMHMPVLCAVLPIAAAYADQVEVEYCNGQRHRLGLMSIIRGEQASNKSICKTVVDVWKRQFDQEDALARQREDEWKEQRKRRKANEKAPEDPHVLIRMVPVTVSCSTLLKRLKNAQGHTLYSFGEELDTLRKTNGAGSWSSKYDIYRMGFDHGEWGQDYNSDQAESGVVEVAYNWTMLGTYGAVRRCFKSDNIENGLSSRVLMAEMPDGAFAKLTKFSHRSEDDEARIQEAVTKLRSYSGFIDTPRLRKAIEKWVESKRQEAAKNIDYFALKIADYCLEQQMKAFGETLQSGIVSASQEGLRNTKNHNVFDQLPPVFTMGDLRALKQGEHTPQALNMVIYRWKRDGWIEKIDAQHWRKSSNSK